MRDFELVVQEGEECLAYLKLPTHPDDQTPKLSRSVRVRDFVPEYQGPDVVLDFGEDGILIGIEIM